MVNNDSFTNHSFKKVKRNHKAKFHAITIISPPVINDNNGKGFAKDSIMISNNENNDEEHFKE